MKALLVGAFLALAAPACAADSLLTATFGDFSGGLNDSADPTNVADNESPKAYNVIVDEPLGSLRPRRGYDQCGVTPSGNSATALFSYSKADGSEKLIVSDNATVWETPDCVTFSTVTEGLNTNSRPDFSIVRDDLWIVNGTTHAIVWDGSTATPLDGRANTPSPEPANGNYIEFWRERVWIARTNGAPSSVFFSALTDTAGNDITPSTGSVAWPATNEIAVDQDGGCPIYGIKSYRDRMYAFKGECGIWRIIFNNDEDIQVIKTLAGVGTRFNSSIVEIDNLLHYVGPDGIYAFDGDTARRISDKIPATFESIRQPRGNDKFKTWTLPSDFDDGTLTRISTSRVLGSITPDDELLDDFSDGDYTTNPTWTRTAGVAGFTISSNRLQYANSGAQGAISTPLNNHDGHYQFDATINNSGGARVSFGFASDTQDLSTMSNGYFLDVCFSVSGCANIKIRKKINGGGNDVASGPAADNDEHTYRIVKDSETITVFQDGVEIINFDDDQPFNTGEYVGFDYAADAAGYLVDNIYVGKKSSATWESDEFNAVTVSSWSTMEATHDTGEGSITYSVRSATGSNALTHATYSEIIPGSLIDAATHFIFVQFKVDMTVSSNAASIPQVDDLTANYSQGDVTNQPIFGQVWDNRYWVSGASGTSVNNNLVLVRSKAGRPLSWVPYDLQIGPMVRFNDNFYAACSTCSAIWRMDFGDTDDTGAIQWYWETKDEDYDLPFNRKRILEIITSFRHDDAGSTQVGYSVDSGASWTDHAVDMSGSGRDTDRQHVNDWGRDIRFRVYSSGTGDEATVLGIHGVARPQRFRE